MIIILIIANLAPPPAHKNMSQRLSNFSGDSTHETLVQCCNTVGSPSTHRSNLITTLRQRPVLSGNVYLKPIPRDERLEY